MTRCWATNSSALGWRRRGAAEASVAEITREMTFIMTTLLSERRVSDLYGGAVVALAPQGEWIWI